MQPTNIAFLFRAVVSKVIRICFGLSLPSSVYLNRNQDLLARVFRHPTPFTCFLLVLIVHWNFCVARVIIKRQFSTLYSHSTEFHNLANWFITSAFPRLEKLKLG